MFLLNQRFEANLPPVRHPSVVFGLIALLCSSSLMAADVVVKVSGVNSSQGQIGCSIFEKSPAFPMDGSKAKQQWVAADAAGVMCKFAGIAAGTYAVSVGHDLNGNKRVDTNFLGIPKEGWGVSNNVVPTLRPPTFEEAQFTVKDGADVQVDIKMVY
jgi:uncharacterized protein (DUF2141 family)